MWRDSHQPLSELMERHQPDLLVLCGYRMWKELMARPSVTLEPLASPIQGVDRACWFLGPDGHRALALGICHPSARLFSWKAENAAIENALGFLSGRGV